jgi:hypothetical protein
LRPALTHPMHIWKCTCKLGSCVVRPVQIQHNRRQPTRPSRRPRRRPYRLPDCLLCCRICAHTYLDAYSTTIHKAHVVLVQRSAGHVFPPVSDCPTHFVLALKYGILRLLFERKMRADFVRIRTEKTRNERTN